MASGEDRVEKDVEDFSLCCSRTDWRRAIKNGVWNRIVAT